MKTRFTSMTVALATTMAIGVGSISYAQDKTGTNLTQGAEGAQGPVAQLAMAQNLYAYGLETQNALAALAAAQITLAVDVEDIERDKETTTTMGAEDVTETGTGVDAPADADMMLASAKEFAAGDNALLGIIEDVEAESGRGRIGGPSRTLSRLHAGKTDIFKVPFRGGELAELAILGDGDADLDLLVTDENGNEICKDVSYSDKLYCSWTPRWDGYFLVGVINQGRIRNSYYILTN